MSFTRRARPASQKAFACHTRALVNLIRMAAAILGDGESQKTLQFASLGFDVSFQELFGTWCTGGTLVLVQRKHVKTSPVCSK